jgi:hypothetical protein
VLNVMYHSVEVIPNASPYAATDAAVAGIVECQRALFDHLQKNYQVIGVGLSGLPGIGTRASATAALDAVAAGSQASLRDR